MRHLKSGNRLGMTTAHRRAVMRNMVTSILENGQIKCTLARAKEVRKPLEKMISLGKRGSLHARRLALKFVKSKKAISFLFGELAERYKERNGGFCRIIKLGKKRLGDNSEMAIVQLLGSEKDTLSGLKSKSEKKKPQKKKASSVLQDVSKEIISEDKIKDENKTVKKDSLEKKELDSKNRNISSVNKVTSQTKTQKNEPVNSKVEENEKKNENDENTDTSQSKTQKNEPVNSKVEENEKK